MLKKDRWIGFAVFILLLIVCQAAGWLEYVCSLASENYLASWIILILVAAQNFRCNLPDEDDRDYDLISYISVWAIEVAFILYAIPFRSEVEAAGYFVAIIIPLIAGLFRYFTG